MATIETTQVTLRLVQPDDTVPTPDGDVRGDSIIKTLKQNKLMKNDDHGPYVSVMFDGVDFKFRPKRGDQVYSKTVGPTVAAGLRRSSGIIVGNDKLTGPIAPFLIEIGRTDLMGAAEEDGRTVTPTTCPVCREDQKTLPRLARHLMKHYKDHPELVPSEDVAQEEPVDPEFEASDGNEDAS